MVALISMPITNPLVFPETEEFLLGGNFHGQPVAMAADYLSIGLAELGSVSERRVERLVNPQLSGLPAFLVKGGHSIPGICVFFSCFEYVEASSNRNLTNLL